MTSKEWGVAVWALFHSQPNVVPVATIDAIIADLAASEASEAALREMLEKYGTHSWSCPTLSNRKASCMCGLDAALAAEEE